MIPAFYEELKQSLEIDDGKKKLNIGCGHLSLKGYTNLDGVNLDGVNVVHDLEDIPYPFADNTFDEIFCRHIMEHLTDVPKVLNELWRISKPGGKIDIIVPHLSTLQGWEDLTHKHLFGYRSLDYVAQRKLGEENIKNEFFSHEYTDKCFFDIEKIDIEFPRFMRFLRLNRICNKFALVWEEYFSNFLPARGISYELQVIKVPYKNENLTGEKDGL